MLIRASQLIPPVVVAVAAVAFWRSTLDVFNTTKATVVVVGALTLLGWLGVELARRRALVVPTGPWAWALAAFLVALVVAVVVSPTPLRSSVGVTGRHGGLIPYAAAAVLALVFGVATNRDPIGAHRVLTRSLAVASVVAGGYVLLQAAGLDPLPWSTVEGGEPHFGTFGNVDFASAWLGIVTVLLAGAAAGPRNHHAEVPTAGEGMTASAGPPPIERAVLGAVAGVCALAAVLTGSLQGPVILALGLPVVALAALRPRPRTAVAVGTAALVVGAALLAGPASSVVTGAQRSLETRLPKWEAALVMAADAPLVGHGLDTYGDRWFAARPADHAAEEGLARTVDNAHDVPLHLLTGGGVLLAGAWLAVVLLVPTWGLWRTWRTGRSADGSGPAAWAGGADPASVGLVAAWFGYLLQAAVSIDVPPLMALGLVLSAAVAARGGTLGARAVRLPARAAVPAGIALAAVAVLAVIPATRAARADGAGWDADVARARAAVLPAESATLRAMTLAPWESRYPAAHGAWLTGAGQTRAALDWQVEALRRDPRSLTHALNVARLLTALGDRAGAAQAYARVLEIDPQTPEVVVEARSLDPPQSAADTDEGAGAGGGGGGMPENGEEAGAIGPPS